MTIKNKLANPPDPNPTADRLVTVSLDAEAKTYAVQCNWSAKHPSDSVQWNFAGVPSGWQPELVFLHRLTDGLENPCDPENGPFAGVSPQAGGIFGQPPEDWGGVAAGEYEYRVQLVPEDKPLTSRSRTSSGASSGAPSRRVLRGGVSPRFGEMTLDPTGTSSVGVDPGVRPANPDGGPPPPPPWEKLRSR
jgi:hypothetical protein